MIPRRILHRDSLFYAFAKVISGKNNLAIFGDKIPNIRMNVISELRDGLCGIKRIYVVRNPIFVITSSLRRTKQSKLGRDSWHVETLEEAVWEWWDNIEVAKKDKYEFPDEVFVLKYEDIFSEFEQCAEQLAAFLSVEHRFCASVVKAIPEDMRDFSIGEDGLNTAKMMLRPYIDTWSILSCDEILKIQHCTLPILPWDRPISATAAVGRRPLMQGFGEPEEWGTWSVEPCARIAFNVDNGLHEVHAVTVTLKFRMYLRRSNTYRFILKMTDGSERNFEIPHSDGISEVSVAAPVKNGVVELEFLFNFTKGEGDEPLNDSRRLSMGIVSILVSRLD